uniref:Uncharacterized protein n=2 Tax=Avena sativa TaxID=4498 RepID=A0ACD5XFA4_AVESA
MAKSATARTGSTHGSRLPEEIFVWEILVRLPHRDLIRCRAVSHAWRRAASARDLLLEHHRRQPSLPLINRRGTPGADGRRWFNVAALDQDHEQLQPVARLDESHVCVKASCDGLLLLTEGVRGTPFGMRASICNPSTRQIGHLPQLKGYVAVGLYRHRPTGEYRLLLRCGVFKRRTMFVVELDRRQLPLRRVECVPDASRYRLSPSAPVLLNGHLHWTWHPPVLPQQTETKNILLFDTTAESFHQMCSPAVHSADLFEMDGVLGMYSWENGMRVVRIWAMEDYENQVWSLKHSVELLVPEVPLIQERRSLMVVYQEGAVRLLVACGGLLLSVDTQGKLLASYHNDGHSLSISKQFLKQSLVSHTFFSTLQDDTTPPWHFI